MTQNCGKICPKAQNIYQITRFCFKKGFVKQLKIMGYLVSCESYKSLLMSTKKERSHKRTPFLTSFILFDKNLFNEIGDNQKANPWFADLTFYTL